MEYEAWLGTSDLCRKHGVSEATCYRWQSKYGSMETSDAAFRDVGKQERHPEKDVGRADDGCGRAERGT